MSDESEVLTRVESGVGRITSQMARMTGRGVKYWPAPRDDSAADRWSSSS